MKPQCINDVLFPVIRASLGLSSVVPSISYDDFKQLKLIGKAQSILPLIWEGLRKTVSQKAWEDEFKDDVYQCICRFVWREESIKGICRALDNNGIAYILLKGASIQKLYPEDWMRTSNDIDILVHKEELSLAISAIENGTTFRAGEKGFHDVSMTNENYHLELHFSLKEKEERFDPLLLRAWEYSERTNNGYQYDFKPEYKIFYITAHMAHHFTNGGIGIRPIIDLWLLFNKTAFDNNELNDLLCSCGLLKFYEKCCELMSVWIDGKDYTDTTQLMEKYFLSGGALGSRSLANTARQRHKRGWKYV